MVTQSTCKKFAQFWVFNILKRESTISANEEIIVRNICNVELQPNIYDVQKYINYTLYDIIL